MKVAKSELTFSTPTLAKIAVNAANAADMEAQNCHDENRFFIVLTPQSGIGARAAEGMGGRAPYRRPEEKAAT